MPRKSRLTREDFQRLAVVRSKPYFGRFFTVAMYPAEGQAQAAVVVAKKHVRHAHERNTVKRRAREILRPLLSSLRSGSYIFYAKKQSQGQSFVALQDDILELLNQAKVRE